MRCLYENYGRYFPKVSILALSDGMHLNPRTAPHLPPAFSEGDSNTLLETHRVTAAPLGELRALFSEKGDLALPDGRHLIFRTASHLPAVFSGGVEIRFTEHLR